MTESNTASIYEAIPGGSELLDWFGWDLSFHDAEILDFHLRRNGHSTLTIHFWDTTNKVRNGYFLREKHAVVKFSIERIIDLKIDGFSHQNVIDGLTLERVKFDGNTEAYELQIEPCYGLGGSIRAEKISVSYTAGKP
ncbi:MAG: hypothetical protein GY798_29675 [Hyphomicrobiales bacterium]|nr:hypothetical protein [Hyphomicrobiales bacterium]